VWFSTVIVAAIAAATQGDPLASRSKGARAAPIVVYEMADFQCPACRLFALVTMPEIERDFVRTGTVRWVFVNMPLPSLHAHAVAAAEVAMCAARQDTFWLVHDALFVRQPEWTRLDEAGPYLVALAESVGVARTALVPCLQDKSTRREVEQDRERAIATGARQTPTFYIEGSLLVGAAPARVFRRVLDSLYREKTGAP
jgi:protein-disulfide isomerase